MSTASTVTSAVVLTAAQRVRTVTTAVMVGLFIRWIWLQAFDLPPGVQAPDADRPVQSDQLDRVVGQQEATGLTCRVAPALTDTVVVSLAGDAGVTVLDIDDAIDAMRDGSASILRYCLWPAGVLPMIEGVPRRPVRRPSRTPPRPVHGSIISDRVETRGAVGWNVRTLAGSSKEYRCPGCHQLVRPGAGHLLVWPVEKSLLSAEAIDERRHWHTHCWQRGF